MSRIVERAVNAGHLRPHFRADDFILLTRGTMANITDTADLRPHIALVLDGIRRPQP